MMIIKLMKNKVDLRKKYFLKILINLYEKMCILFNFKKHENYCELF